MAIPLNNMDMKGTLIAIPVYNEAGYVDDILTAVSQYSGNILVINDGSDDGTDELLKKNTFIKVVTHKSNEGYGQSLMDAFTFAKASAYDWVITMDCDYQHQPSCLPRFFNEIQKDDSDIISGSRYLDIASQKTVKPPAERMAINKEITKVLNQTLGLELTDSFCGFKAYRVKSLQELKLRETGYGLPLELWIQAAAENLRIREIAVPLIYHDPKRNFAGLLEVPRYRMQYYRDVINQALAQYGYQNTEKLFCS